MSAASDYQRHLEVVRELNERVATAHERVACPVCGAHRGERCSNLITSRKRVLKHLHAARLRAAGIPMR